MSYHIEEAHMQDAEDILRVTNDAFMADAFFKKPAYHLRFDIDTVHQMIQGEHNVFLLARQDDSKEVLGSMFLHWESDAEKVSDY